MNDEQQPRHEQENQQDHDLQEKILKELSALLNTLASMEEVLTDIDRLTSPQGDDSSVFVKQQALIDELRLWNSDSNFVEQRD